MHEGQPYPLRLDISCVDGTPSATIDFPDYLIYGSGTTLNVDGDALELMPDMLPKMRLRVVREGDSLLGKCEGFRDVTADVLVERVFAMHNEYAYEDVAFENGDAKLAGTIVKPVGEGPFPLIVWTHGSGNDTRQTFYYSGRAHLMAQRGVASLIYDKRGAGESTGENAYDIALLIEDALAAVALVKTRADVDTAGIGIAGFSQGGWIAPAVAARDSDVDFVVVGATPGVTGADQNIFSMTKRMRRDGEPAEDIQAAKRFVTALYEFYRTGERRDSTLAAIENAKAQPWWDNKWVSNVTFIPDELPHGPSPSWAPFFVDPIDDWRRVRVPVLSMWGANDVDVPVRMSRKRIDAALTEAANLDFHLQVFPDASHGFWVERKEDAPWDWPRQAPGAHELMVRWVLQVVP